MTYNPDNVPGARTMYDSTNYLDIPQGVQMVAGYLDGAYAWPAEGWRYHAASRHVGITVTGGNLDANVIDFETGNVDATQAAAWAKAKVARGDYPTIYVQESRLGELQTAMLAVGIHAFGIWRANWNDVPDLQQNDLAHQYANPTLTGAHYDKSVVQPYWPDVDPVPVTPSPSPTPPPPQPAPPVPPAPVPASNLDQARAAWARLGELLITDFPGAVERVAAAIAKIQNLP